VSSFWLTTRDQARLTIVSPNDREVVLVANVLAGAALTKGTLPRARVRGPGNAIHVYQLPAREASIRIPVHVRRGVNRLVLSPANATSASSTLQSEPQSQALMTVTQLHLAGG
jgi:hypothetical protein